MNTPASLSFPTIPTDDLPADCSIDARPGVSSSPVLSQSVGAVLPDPIRTAEDRLDAYIARCGDDMVAAMNAKDQEGARRHADAMYAAIHSRSPAHQARKAAELEQRVAEQADYFGHRGELARAAMERKTT